MMSDLKQTFLVCTFTLLQSRQKTDDKVCTFLALGIHKCMLGYRQTDS